MTVHEAMAALVAHFEAGHLEYFTCAEDIEQAFEVLRQHNQTETAKE